MRVVGYIRVSTTKQADKGVSLEAQEAKLRAYCDLYEHSLIEVVVDSQSAKDLHRPSLQSALGSLQSGRADGLLVIKLDRLTRSVRDLGELLEEYFCAGKHTLMSVGESLDTASAAGRLVINILASVAQWEREVISERTSAALQHLKAQGRYTGGQVRYGFRLGDDGRLEMDDIEQEVLALVKALRGQGLSGHVTAARLNALGYRNRAGGEFHAAQVARMES